VDYIREECYKRILNAGEFQVGEEREQGGEGMPMAMKDICKTINDNVGEGGPA
jgi:hypothetical protein